MHTPIWHATILVLDKVTSTKQQVKLHAAELLLNGAQLVSVPGHHGTAATRFGESAYITTQVRSRAVTHSCSRAAAFSFMATSLMRSPASLSSAVSSCSAGVRFNNSWPHARHANQRLLLAHCNTPDRPNTRRTAANKRYRGMRCTGMIK